MSRNISSLDKAEQICFHYFVWDIAESTRSSVTLTKEFREWLAPRYDRLRGNGIADEHNIHMLCEMFCSNVQNPVMAKLGPIVAKDKL